MSCVLQFPMQRPAALPKRCRLTLAPPALQVHPGVLCPAALHLSALQRRRSHSQLQPATRLTLTLEIQHSTNTATNANTEEKKLTTAKSQSSTTSEAMEPGEVFPSLTVDINSPTPYTDATQVSDTNNTMMHNTTRDTTITTRATILTLWATFIRISGMSSCSRQ